jgi:pre-mRNA-processing factor 19
MFCAISGEIPKDPVVSKKTGILFEKTLIEKYLKVETNGDSCPITNTPMTLGDLLPVHVSSGTASRPRLPLSECSSIPGLLTTLQNEWDELMLETFTLKQHLDATRKELSHSLFQHEAACRVIARLTRERDEAHHMINTLQTNAVSNGNGSVSEKSSEMEIAAPAVAERLEDTVFAELNEKCKQLSSSRKGRKVNEKVTTKEAMLTLAQVASYTPHKADKTGGVTCVAVAQDSPSGFTLSLSGSGDKTAILTDLSSGKALSKLTGHSKKITAVGFVNNSTEKLATASADKSVKIWSSSNGKYAESWSFKDHDAEVSDISIHPTGNYMISLTADSSWYFLDIARGQCLKKVTKDEQFKYTSCAFHPDGLILGTTTDTGALKIWDIREQENVANLAEHTSSINSVSFSENGYLVASGSDDGDVKIWDLRKLQCTKTLKVGTAPVTSVAFDSSGVFLAIGGGGDAGTDVQVKVVKDWSQSAMLEAQNTKPVSGVCWSEYANSLVTCSVDRTVKVYKPESA